jgi:8-oxo-dGTP pyrophosphatase MutT (NUDIX family)
MDTAEQRSAGIILYTMRNGVPYVLLMVQNNGRYKRKGKKKVIDIGAKGAIEEGEDEGAAALREAEEETGVRPAIEKDFREVAKYRYKDILWKTGRMTHISKSVVYFLALLSEEDARRIKISHEHLSFRFVNIDDAIKEAGKASQKRIRRKVRDYVKNIKKRG